MRHGRILFVSDLHLDGAAPESIERFVSFLKTDASNCDALYILGDLFETWIGDDDADPARARVAAALQELTAGGVPCLFQHGNRDFLLGAGFMKASGCKLLPDPATVLVGDRRFALTHGDQLCTGDIRYQRFRQLTRNGIVQHLWRLLPLALRRRFAAGLRRRSHAYTRQAPQSIMDVAPQAVDKMVRSTAADVLVHGHTHRPGVYWLEVDHRRRCRIVLGDWPDQASALVVDARGEFTIAPIPPLALDQPAGSASGAPEWNRSCGSGSSTSAAS